MTQASALLGAALLTIAARPASAAVHDYVLTLPNQDGVLLGTPFAAETVVYTVRADTATLTPYPVLANWPAAGPGKCLTATTATVQVGALPAVALTGSVLYCSADGGTLTGVYFNGENSWNHHLDAGPLDLMLPGSTAGPGLDHNLATAYAIPVAGGTLTVSTDSSSGFTATAAVVAVAPAAVPTLTEWGMILLGMMLAGGAALHIHHGQIRRQGLKV